MEEDDYLNKSSDEEMRLRVGNGLMREERVEEK
jgi:hypothetical protein